MKQYNNHTYIIGHTDTFINQKIVDKDELCQSYTYINAANPNYILGHLNHFYSEFTGIFQIYKEYCNHQNNNDIISICHYRRIIPDKHIHIDRIIDNQIQYYFKYIYDAYIPLYDYKGVQLEQYNNYIGQYKGIQYLIGLFNPPKFIYDDIETYLNVQDIIPQHILIDMYNQHKTGYASHEIFTCQIYHLERIVNFIFGFITYMNDKYDLMFDEERHKQFFIDHVFPHYTNINNIVMDNIMSRGYTLQPILMMRYDMKSFDYGYDTPGCNCWRLFSYVIEILIGIYILCNRSFIDKHDMFI